MLISRKRFERELEKAREEGYCKAIERHSIDENFRCIHERIDRLADMINKPNPIGFEQGERKC